MRIACSIAGLALVSAWIGCSSDDPAGPGAGAADAGLDAKGPTTTNSDTGSTTPPVELKPYQIVGRFDSRDAAGPRFGWPGTQIVAKFTGDSVSVDLSDTTGEDQFDWSVDGAPPTLLKIEQKDKMTYPLASGLAAGEHTLVLTKRTESSVGESQLFAVTAASLPGTAPPFTRHIEMIGDSITAGYGVLGADETCSFSPDTEDESMAWGALAAAKLSAEHTAIAWSGIGLVQDDEGDTDNIMPNRYPRALATDETSVWTASQFEPDVIVLALGTNDLDADGADPGDAFQTKLVAFMTTLRTTHPNAQIVLASSPMLTDEDHNSKTEQQNYMKGAIDARKTAGDTKVSFLDIPTQDQDADGIGCDYHPSAKTQAKMGDALTAHIKTLMSW